MDPAEQIARAVQETLSRHAPRFGYDAPTWDELEFAEEGEQARNLILAVMGDLLRQGVLIPASQGQLAHLAADWDAQAAMAERNPGAPYRAVVRAEVLRDCAKALRDLISGLPWQPRETTRSQDREPVPPGEQESRMPRITLPCRRALPVMALAIAALAAGCTSAPVPSVTVSGAAATATPMSASPLYGRTDLIYSSQIGAWDTNGGALTTNPVAFANASRLGIRVIRFQMHNVPADLGGSEQTATFTTALSTIARLGAIPLIGLPPISGQQLPGGPQPWSYAWQKWIVAHAAAKGAVLFEMGNEPNNRNYGAFTPSSYFSQLWSGVPGLKAYARSLGYTIYMGGPAWMNWTGAQALPQVEQFLALCEQKYKATGNQDWLPDFVSTHGYGNGTALTAQAAHWDALRTWVNANITGGTGIRFANTEYNYAIQSKYGTAWQSQSAMDAYYRSAFAMFSGKTTDGSQRLWLADEFTIMPGGTGLLLLNSDGSYAPAGLAFKAIAASVPRQ